MICGYKNVMKTLKLIFTVSFLIVCSNLFATHNRAGEITYTQIGASPFTLEFTLTTYTNIGNQIQADRCQMTFYFGDGDSCVANRVNGPSGTCQSPAMMGEVILNAPGGQGGVKKNVYKCIHTYAGGGIFTVSATDPNRNDGIINIPGSVNVPFYIIHPLIMHVFVKDLYITQMQLIPIMIASLTLWVYAKVQMEITLLDIPSHKA
jgi:hypothetical protein